ncbi:RsmE family RNA methyltransferase, partial [Bacillus altitudinis]|uniref:RsmE family RNA methyltransferase n=1 Tax=Bacillus altitudinis TaxID=293387 RepID=UPI0011A2DD5A
GRLGQDYREKIKGVGVRRGMEGYFMEVRKEEVREKGEMVIKGEDVDEVGNVMGMKGGEEIVWLRTEGFEGVSKIDRIRKEEVICELEGWRNENGEVGMKVRIGRGVGKGDKVEWIMEKGREVGGSGFIGFEGGGWITKLEEKK